MTRRTRSDFDTLIQTIYASNTTGDIDADDLRMGFDDTWDSLPIKNITNRDPTATDDSPDYQPLDVWLNTSSDHVFICRDSTQNAADWVLVSGLTTHSVMNQHMADNAVTNRVVQQGSLDADRLKATNNPSNHQVPTFDATTGGVTWSDTISSFGENNVQSDWNETDVSSDAYIQNKPTIPTQTTNADIDARIADWAETGNTDVIPDSKLPDIPDVYDWAESGNTDVIPDSKLPTIPTQTTNADIDARIADWAETGNTSIIPSSKLPTPPTVPTNADIDARIADWAETGNTDTIPIAKIPDGIGSGTTTAVGGIPQSLTITNRSGTMTEGSTLGLNTTAVGTESSLVTASSNNIIFSATGQYRIYGTYNITSPGRCGPGVTVSGTGVNILGYGNDMVDVASSNLSVNRYVDFVVTDETQPITISLIHRTISESSTAQTNISVVSTGSFHVASIGGTRGERGERGLSGGDDAYDWATEGNTDVIPDSKLPTIPDNNAIDARVQAGVLDWAESGNTDVIPSNKLPTIPDNNAIDARIADWAETSNTDVIPDSKLPTIPDNNAIDARVQAGVLDWAETGNTDVIPTSKLPELGSDNVVLQDAVPTNPDNGLVWIKSTDYSVRVYNSSASAFVEVQ